jgi:hypothetical protein
VLTTLLRAFSSGNQSGVRRGPKVGEDYNKITSKQTRGVSHCGLAIYSKKHHLKSKDE